MISGQRTILCLGTTPTLQRTMQFASVSPGGVNRATAVTEYGSGKSLNVARVVKTLGHPVVAIAPLGGDRGAKVRRSMAEAGIELEVLSVEPETRLCTTVIDEAAEQATELVEEHAPLPPEVGDRLLELLARRLPGARMLVASGSLAAGLPVDFYAKTVRLAREAGVPTLLDASGDPLRAAMAERPEIVKINRSELGAALGVPVGSLPELSAAMAQFKRLHDRWLVVTDGPNGSYVTEGDIPGPVQHLSAPQVRPVSPIGSGDAFAAGLAAALAEGIDMWHALRWGAACGAANALTPHAGHLEASKVAELLEHVRISASYGPQH